MYATTLPLPSIHPHIGVRYVEFADTIFLIVRGKPVSWLHYLHHIGAPINMVSERAHVEPKCKRKRNPATWRACVRAHVRACVRVCVCMCECACACQREHVRTCACVHACACMCVRARDVCARVKLRMCACVCACACAGICGRVCACAFVCVRVRACARARARARVRTHVCTLMYRLWSRTFLRGSSTGPSAKAAGSLRCSTASSTPSCMQWPSVHVEGAHGVAEWGTRHHTASSPTDHPPRCAPQRPILRVCVRVRGCPIASACMCVHPKARVGGACHHFERSAARTAQWPTRHDARTRTIAHALHARTPLAGTRTTPSR